MDPQSELGKFAFVAFPRPIVDNSKAEDEEEIYI